MSSDDVVWRPGTNPPRPELLPGEVYRPEILAVIEETIDSLSHELRELSDKIHKCPKLKYEECFVHKEYTHFMEAQGGWNVQRNHLLETAWAATYTHGQGGRVLGINSEMDALPGIGHACGHNLIGIAGVAVACAAKAAMERLNIDGKVILLGTPAEEGRFGKLRLWDQGAYKEMDVCLMCHPAPGPPHSISLSGSLAVAALQVEYKGKPAHAGLSPWEGKNALDAAVSAYTNIGLLRQQVKPTHRMHGVFSGMSWAPNIIPDNCTVEWVVRAPVTEEVEDTASRVKACFEAAATATGTEISWPSEIMLNGLVQNKVLGRELADVVRKRYGDIDYEFRKSHRHDMKKLTWTVPQGNVFFRMPGLHPGFSIPTAGGNHTKEFEEVAATDTSHEACYTVSKALAHVGMRVLTDDGFFEEVKSAFKEGKESGSS